MTNPVIRQYLGHRTSMRDNLNHALRLVPSTNSGGRSFGSHAGVTDEDRNAVKKCNTDRAVIVKEGLYPCVYADIVGCILGLLDDTKPCNPCAGQSHSAYFY